MRVLRRPQPWWLGGLIGVTLIILTGCAQAAATLPPTQTPTPSYEASYSRAAYVEKMGQLLEKLR